VPGEPIQFDMIVGLGNPGTEHENQRHNAGFWYLDELARDLGASPYNYMNNSGQGVAAMARFFKLDMSKVLVAHDELDLPPGQVRVKNGGGHGGHNGLRDIIARTGRKDFWRLRIGIGHPGHKSAVVGYVLKRATKEHQQLIDDAIYLAMRESATLIDGDINVATKNLHSHKPDSMGSDSSGQ